MADAPSVQTQRERIAAALAPVEAMGGYFTHLAASLRNAFEHLIAPADEPAKEDVVQVLPPLPLRPAMSVSADMKPGDAPLGAQLAAAHAGQPMVVLTAEESAARAEAQAAREEAASAESDPAPTAPAPQVAETAPA